MFGATLVLAELSKCHQYRSDKLWHNCATCHRELGDWLRKQLEDRVAAIEAWTETAVKFAEGQKKFNAHVDEFNRTHVHVIPPRVVVI